MYEKGTDANRQHSRIQSCVAEDEHVCVDPRPLHHPDVTHMGHLDRYAESNYNFALKRSFVFKKRSK